MIKKILCRNIFLFLIIALMLSISVSWSECFIKRGKYLLGIAYNGNFKNMKDNDIYEDYLERHGMTPENFLRTHIDVH